MTAVWKQKKFERLVQKNVVEELRAKVAELALKVDTQKRVIGMMEHDADSVIRQRDEYAILARRYLKLRTEEVMIATPDGFKLVTGEELDIHCGTMEEKTWWAQPLKPMTYTVSADDALDGYSMTHAQHVQINERFRRALEKSMLHSASVLKKELENGFNTRSKSEETNQEDS